MKKRWCDGCYALRGALHEMSEALGVELVLADPTDQPHYVLYLKRQHLRLVKESMNPASTDDGHKVAVINKVNAKVRKVYKRYFYDL